MNKEIQRQIEETEKQNIKLKYLSEKYSDLEIRTNRWKNQFFTSKSSASICNKFYLKRNCGCCNDSPISLCIYFEDEQTKESIYCFSPDEWFIGEGSYYAIERLNINKVKEKLIENGFNNKLIMEIINYLEENKYKNEEDEDIP